jgi:hypothetical protein
VRRSALHREAKRAAKKPQRGEGMRRFDMVPRWTNIRSYEVRHTTRETQSSMDKQAQNNAAQLPCSVWCAGVCEGGLRVCAKGGCGPPNPATTAKCI